MNAASDKPLLAVLKGERQRLAPRWMMPPIVVVTSPQGARDVLTATFPAVDRDFPFMTEQQKLNGGSLLNFSHKEWVGRRRMLQPVFTTARIAELNEQMYDIATDAATSWRDGTEIDLDQESRRITMRVLGRTIMGFEPGSYTDELVDPLRRISKYIADRGRAPVKPPSWVPTKERRFAVKFNKVAHDLAAQILHDCRADPQLSAPLVRAMMEARDPETGEPLTDEDIRKAFRKLAKANHPDVNPGNAAAGERFKKITAANDILSDPEKRRQYDAGEIDGKGDPRRPFWGHAGAGAGASVVSAGVVLAGRGLRERGDVRGRARALRGGRLVRPADREPVAGPGARQHQAHQ